MRDYISPDIKSYTSEEILELIGPAETQYSQTATEDLSTTGACLLDTWSFNAEAGTNVTLTGVPGPALDISLAMYSVGPVVTLFNVNANGLGGTETGSAVIPSTKTWYINVASNNGNGSYTLTLSADRPISGLTLVADDMACP